MNLIMRGRSAGKTTVAIKRAAALDAQGNVAYIVCLDRHQAQYTANRAEALGLDIRYPMTLSEVLRGNFGERVTHLVFDNADMVLDQIAGHAVADTATFTIDQQDRPFDDVVEVLVTITNRVTNRRATAVEYVSHRALSQCAIGSDTMLSRMAANCADTAISYGVHDGQREPPMPGVRLPDGSFAPGPEYTDYEEPIAAVRTPDGSLLPVYEADALNETPPQQPKQEHTGMRSKAIWMPNTLAGDNLDLGHVLLHIPEGHWPDFRERVRAARLAMTNYGFKAVTIPHEFGPIVAGDLDLDHRDYDIHRDGDDVFDIPIEKFESFRGYVEVRVTRTSVEAELYSGDSPDVMATTYLNLLL